MRRSSSTTSSWRPIAYFAYEASSDLAAERGSYSTFEGSKWSRGILPPDTVDLLEEERGESIDVPRGGRMDWTSLREKIQRQGMRNSNVLAIAPTATISNIMGSSPRASSRPSRTSS
jgi:ribonucleoside-diphosphate reductase alpha chain